MELDDFRWSALARYKDASLESAVLVLALSRAPTHSHFDIGLYDLVSVRAHVRMLNEMHLLCYNARKALEVASIIDPTIKVLAKKSFLHSAGQSLSLGDGVNIEVSSLSYDALLSRFVHSLISSVVEQK